MARPDPHNPSAAGFPLALAILAGVIVGVATGQPSLGFIGGVVVGSAVAVAVWLVDRNTKGR